MTNPTPEMKSAEHWIDLTPGVIEDGEHRNDLINLYTAIQLDARAPLQAKLDEANDMLAFWKAEKEKACDERDVLRLTCEKMREALKTLLAANHCDDHCAELADEKIECIHTKAKKLLSSLTPPIASDEVGELRKLQMKYSTFVAAMDGALLGLSTHPNDVPFNGFLISKESAEKLSVIHDIVKQESQAFDAAMSKTKGEK